MAGVFSGSLAAQESRSIAGRATLQSTGEGIPEVAITLCPDSGRKVILVTEGVAQLPARDQIQAIRISSAGEPGQISVTSVVDDCSNERRTTTDNTGRFVFNGVVPGPYRVHAQRNGYIGEFLRGSPPAVLTQSATVTAQQSVPDISFAFIKSGAIAGTVLDANGKPLASADVQVLSAKSASLLASRQTDDRGQYRLFGLPPGEFIVVVRVGTVTTINPLPDGKTSMFIANVSQPGIAPRYTPTYYPSVLSSADAKTIVLREGEEASGIDVVLRSLP